jgi:beta-lactamase superfamily II metal-dependent hydrolase
VGQGDAALIRTPQGRTILIDGGPAGAGEAVLRYLAGEALSSIDLLVGTHPHEDHLGGLIAVLENLPVGRVIDSGRIHTSQTYERYLTLIEEKGIPFEVGRAGKTIVLDPSITLKVLHPGADPGGGNLNNSSVVLGLAYGKVEFLFTGDLETEAETELLERGFCAASSTVLKVAHHGSSSSSSAEFLETVAPVIAVISAGRDNSYGHPHAEILDRLTGVGARVYRTDLLGTIVITTDGDTITIKSESGLPAGGGVMPERRG